MSEKKSDPAAKPDERKPARAGDETPPEEAAVDDPAARGEGEASAWAAGEEAEAATAQEVLAAENADLKDRLLRAHAEMENLRRRTERDKADTAKYAVSAFARDVLTVGDNITRAIEAVPKNEIARDPALKALLEGVQMTERELLNILERHGIAKLDPQGERFDPNRHQAMFEIENNDVPEGTIVEVMQAGYEIGDRILRPAMVAIAKGGEKLPKPGAEDAGGVPKAANDDEPDEPGGGGEPNSGKIGINVDKSA